MKNLVFIVLILLFQGCGGGDSDNESTPISNEPVLSVVSQVPSGASVLPSTDKIIVNFNEVVDESTVIASNVQLSHNVNFTLSTSGKSVTLNLQQTLQRGERYIVSINNIKSIDGKSMKGQSIVDFTTCAQSSTATYKLQWDNINDGDLKNYTVYYGKTTPLTKSNALGSINVNTNSFDFTPFTYSILPCEKFYLSLSAIGTQKSESLLALELNAEAQ